MDRLFGLLSFEGGVAFSRRLKALLLRIDEALEKHARVDGLGQDFKVVTVRLGALKKVGRRCLA